MAADRLIAPLVLFVSVYVATLFVLTWLGFPWRYWSGLISVTIATAMTIGFAERGRWPLGLFVPPALALRDFANGIGWGVTLIGSSALLVVLFTEVSHERGYGFPWLELAAVYVPAVLHEELLFRGYPFQRLIRANRSLALILTAFIFAGLHGNNSAVTALGLINIFLGGLLLGFAYLRYERLWFPIGLHLGWNLMTGPILGHEVSGYESGATVLVERGEGAEWLTGGEFGIEGSALLMAVQIVAIVWLARISSRRPSFPLAAGKEPLQ